MTLSAVKKLCPGDTVFWEDPDGGICSRHCTIQAIRIVDDMIQIQDVDGSVLECFAHELSEVENV